MTPANGTTPEARAWGNEKRKRAIAAGLHQRHEIIGPRAAWNALTAAVRDRAPQAEIDTLRDRFNRSLGPDA